MFDSINKIFLNGFKLFLIILLGVFIYLSYFVSTSIVNYDNTIQFFSYLIGLYLYIITIYIFIIALHKKFERTYFYNIFLVPIIPTLFYLLRIIQYKTLLDINVYDLIGLFLLYFGLLVFTKYYIDYLSRFLIPILFGKSIEDPVGYNFALISIYFKYDFAYFIDNFKLIEDIIENFLKYKLRDVKNVYHHKIQYKIIRYTRKNYHFNNPYFEHILVIRMRCIDTNYIEWLDSSDEFSEKPQPSLVECTHNSLNENDIEIADIDEIGLPVYECFFINQYYEDGDSISPILSIGSETYLAFNNILSKNKEIYYQYEDDILSSNLSHLIDNLFRQYYNKTYGSLLEILKLTFGKKVKPYTTIILIILGLLISICSIIYIFQKNTLDFLQLLIMIPPAIYSMILIYDRYKKEKK